MEAVHVYIRALSRGELTGRRGVFRFGQLPRGQYGITLSYVGYITLDTVVSLQRDTLLTFRMHPSSLAVPEVLVVADKPDPTGSAVRIGQEAIDMIQPTSVSDVLELLPGHLVRDGRLGAVQQASIRQVGQDANTALGTAIMVDGIPLSNNANLSALPGDREVQARSVKNAGLDLRMLSADHYSGAEVVQGIASARYGDLNGGAVMLHAKRGALPLEARCKVDPRTKSAYLGRGFHLPKGAIHTGVEYTYATADERDALQSYQRYSLQGNYSLSGAWASTRYSLGIRASYIGTLQKEKTDEDLVKGLESYRSSFSKYSLALSSQLGFESHWFSSLRGVLSLSLTEDQLLRDKYVVLKGLYSLPVSQTPGLFDGLYLPMQYASRYTIDNRPCHLYAQLEGSSVFCFLGLNHALAYGLNLRYEKNYGRGAEYELTAPPTPTNPESSRPRRYSSLPAYIPLALFLEDGLRAQGEWGSAAFTAGLRLSSLLFLPSRLEALRTPELEPRLNASYSLPPLRLFSRPLRLAFRAGWGRQAKFPTLDMLSPAPAYYDYKSLDYYPPEPAYRRLLVSTLVEAQDNPALQPATSRKWECGLDLAFARIQLHLTYFRETLNRGFTTSTRYLYHEYPLYDYSAFHAPRRPEIADLTCVDYGQGATKGIPSNGKKVLKRGLEYRLFTPEWPLLRTSLMLSGAYFRTTYDISEPVEYQPAETLPGGARYPYVGLYAFSNGRTLEMCNSTLWLNTHIPRVRFIFSTAVQAVWFTSSQLEPHGDRPIAYRDAQGRMHPFTEAEAQDPLLRRLVRPQAENRFDRHAVPLAITINLKAAKEIGSHIRLACFVNRLIGYMPTYRNALGQTVRRDYSPYFGAELKLRL